MAKNIQTIKFTFFITQASDFKLFTGEVRYLGGLL